MIQNKSVDELLTVLNESEEHTDLEAKSLRDDKMRSILETVCSFSNEPNLEGGTILVGIAESREDEGPRFVVEHIDDLDHAQADLATQCKTVFNFPVHPKVSVVKSGKEFVLKVDVGELPATRKPLYFKDRRLPHGAYRRVGGSDLVCTDEDISELFDSSGASYDATPVNASMLEVDPNALKAYRDARAKVNPAAEELTYNDRDLLEALHCTADGNPDQLNVGGGALVWHGKDAATDFADESLVDKGSSLVDKDSNLVDKGSSLVDCERRSGVLESLPKRMSYGELSAIICGICREEYFTKEQLAKLLNRNEGYLKTILVRMINDKLLVHKHPEMKNHPGQAYMAAKGKGVRHD